MAGNTTRRLCPDACTVRETRPRSSAERRGRRLAGSALVAVLLAFAAPASAGAVPDGYLLISGTGTPAGALVRVDTANPSAADLNAAVTITGTGGERVLGIDFRPSAGVLYGVSEASRLYEIDPVTGSAAQVGAPGAVGLDPFVGVFQGLGFDFNPMTDLLRVIEDDGLVNGQDDNFSVNPITGVFTQESDLGGAGTDVDISGVAYTGAVGATQTTLYGVETNQPVAGNSRLVVVGPPAAGSLTTMDSNANGLGLVINSQEIGFDVAGDPTRAFATFQTTTLPQYALYGIDLGVADGGNGTGDAALLGVLGSGATQGAISGFRVRGFALAPPSPPPAPLAAPATPAGPPPPSPASGALDTTAPNTRIVRGPPRRTRARSATFRFRSTEPGSRFRCKLDKKAWRSCRSPKTYRRLRPGLHRFRVRAVDGAGNVDGSPAARKWRVRRAAPRAAAREFSD
jgi:hypothetical protein